MTDRPATDRPSADRITLTGLRGRGRHGVFDFERELGQEFVVDVTLSVDLSKAAETDDLADTIDYGALATAIVGLIVGEPARLIETLAGRIADLCLADSRVHEVDVTVHKPEAPVTVPFADVAVTLKRSRL
jgi:dihydroneopterin aldolase